MNASYKPDEYIDITIRRARVVRERQDDLDRPYLQYVHGECNTLAGVDSNDPAVTITRVAPATWPPQEGDLWSDRDGRLHFASSYCPDYDVAEDRRGIDTDGFRIVLLPQGTDGSLNVGHKLHRPENVLQQCGPMTLVYRKRDEPNGDNR
ncbi:hypothetical protein ACFHW2_11555 [Actinomadura sp. LOL_016]|uniref:hypothetical protein n=1 Tax=unclassified Actinomadura TaxID=2626254 RepID=UPI003A8051ED